ncbi:AMP-binding protein [Chromobacterium haemolyticum]|nr:AMP-binding protein [Chromobacterium haemolyticum]
MPAVLELLLDVAAPRSPDLRLALLSGDWIAPGLAGRLRDAFPALRPISLGGATEASIWSVVHPIAPEDAALASIPYGRPLSNQQCFVRAPDGRERPDGVVGELLLLAAAASRSPIWATRRKPSAVSSSTPRGAGSTAPAILRAGSPTASLSCSDGWTGRSRCRAIGSNWARSKRRRCAQVAWRGRWPLWSGATMRRPSSCMWSRGRITTEMSLRPCAPSWFCICPPICSRIT